MTDFFPAGRTRYPGRNAEEKTIQVEALPLVSSY